MTRLWMFTLLALLLAAPHDAAAQTRNASFTNPNSAPRPADGKPGASPITLAADPAAVDAGETLVNVARRVTVFFYNGFRTPVKVADLQINADGNVRSKVVSNDCANLKTLPPSDRCSIALEVVPSSPGPWTVELLLTHSGQGRIARAEVTGTTLGKADEKSEGLAISKKIAAPLDFGEVRAGEDQATRTMLIENDSNAPLLISTIDLIANSGQGLTLRNTGCKEGDQLKPGESCPITVMWAPGGNTILATDLIVHHNGNLGFVVVPIRGNAKLAEGAVAKNESTGGNGPILNPARNSRADDSRARLDNMQTMPPPSPERIAESLPPIRIQRPDTASREPPAAPTHQSANIPVKLIGTVGGRAILGLDNDAPVVVGLGETAQLGGIDVELLQLDGTRAVVNIDGSRKELSLRNAPSYIQSKSEPAAGAAKSAPLMGAPTAPTLEPASPLGAGASNPSSTSSVVQPPSSGKTSTAAPLGAGAITPQMLQSLVN